MMNQKTLEMRIALCHQKDNVPKQKSMNSVATLRSSTAHASAVGNGTTAQSTTRSRNSRFRTNRAGHLVLLMAGLFLQVWSASAASRAFADNELYSYRNDSDPNSCWDVYETLKLQTAAEEQDKLEKDLKEMMMHYLVKAKAKDDSSLLDLHKPWAKTLSTIIKNLIENNGQDEILDSVITPGYIAEGDSMDEDTNVVDRGEFIQKLKSIVTIMKRKENREMEELGPKKGSSAARIAGVLCGGVLAASGAGGAGYMWYSWLSYRNRKEKEQLEEKEQQEYLEENFPDYTPKNQADMSEVELEELKEMLKDFEYEKEQLEEKEQQQEYLEENFPDYTPKNQAEMSEVELEELKEMLKDFEYEPEISSDETTDAFGEFVASSPYVWGIAAGVFLIGLILAFTCHNKIKTGRCC